MPAAFQTCGRTVRYRLNPAERLRSLPRFLGIGLAQGLGRVILALAQTCQPLAPLKHRVPQGPAVCGRCLVFWALAWPKVLDELTLALAQTCQSLAPLKHRVPQGPTVAVDLVRFLGYGRAQGLDDRGVLVLTLLLDPLIGRNRHWPTIGLQRTEPAPAPPVIATSITPWYKKQHWGARGS